MRTADLDQPGVDELEARALWHAELIGAKRWKEGADLDDGDDDGDYLGSVGCWNCNEGWVVTCMDDLCRGADECMHGDGMAICRECKGEGWL